MQSFPLQCTWPFASFSTRQPDLQLITKGISCTCQVRKTASPSGPYNAVRSVEVQPAVELIEVVIYRRHWQAKSYRAGCGSVTRPEVIQCNIFILKSANGVMEQRCFHDTNQNNIPPLGYGYEVHQFKTNGG